MRRLGRLPFALICQRREFSDICQGFERFDGLSIWQSISYWLCCCQLVVFDRYQLLGFFPVRKLAAERTPFFLPKPVCARSHSVFNISHRTQIVSSW